MELRARDVKCAAPRNGAYKPLGVQAPCWENARWRRDAPQVSLHPDRERAAVGQSIDRRLAARLAVG